MFQPTEFSPVGELRTDEQIIHCAEYRANNRGDCKELRVAAQMG